MGDKLNETVNDISAVLPRQQRQVLQPANRETVPAWDPTGDTALDPTGEPAPRPGSFFIGTHVGMNAEICLQPEIVPIPQLPLVGLLQSAHQVRQVVLATEPERPRNRKPPGRQLVNEASRRPELGAANGSANNSSHPLRDIAARPARTTAR